MPPGLARLAVASLGALGLAVGLVVAVNGRVVGLALAAGGAALLLWSVLRTQ